MDLPKGIECRIEFARLELVRGLGLEVSEEDFPSQDVRRFANPGIIRLGVVADDLGEAIEVGGRIVEGEGVEEDRCKFAPVDIGVKGSRRSDCPWARKN